MSGWRKQPVRAYSRPVGWYERLMMKNIKTGLSLVLISVYLLTISALLALAINQAIVLTRLYRVSTSPGPATDFGRPNPGFSFDLLIMVFITAILFLLVRRQLRRLLLVSIAALLLFVALNLYSGRHFLPQLFIWPTPPSLAAQYSQALAANNLETALDLTDQSEACEKIVGQVFQEHQAKLRQRVANDRHEVTIQNTSVKRVTTFYDKPVPPRFIMMQPAPSQLVTTMVKMENGQTIWLNLKMHYRPFWGTRYICG